MYTTHDLNCKAEGDLEIITGATSVWRGQRIDDQEALCQPQVALLQTACGNDRQPSSAPLVQPFLCKYPGSCLFFPCNSSPQKALNDNMGVITAAALLKGALRPGNNACGSHHPQHHGMVGPVAEDLHTGVESGGNMLSLDCVGARKGGGDVQWKGLPRTLCKRVVDREAYVK